MSFPEFIHRVVMFFTAIAVMVTHLSVGNNFHVKKEDGSRLTAVLLADTHVGAAFYRKIFFTPGVKDVSKHVKPDLFVVAGDCTDNGNEANWTAFQSVLDRHLTVKERIIALGNHDTWTSYDGERTYEEARDNYLTYANAIMGSDHDEVYFTKEVNGYPFIVLGSEDDTTDAVLSDAQLDWLARTLADTAETYAGKPVFIIHHHPLNFTHTVGEDEHSNGFRDNAVSKRLREIMDGYQNVFYISGHTHFGPAMPSGDPDAFATVEQVGEHITSVNLPCYAYGSFLTGGDGVLGQGLVMDVFDDHVLLRGRNFALCNWVRGFEISVPLT